MTLGTEIFQFAQKEEELYVSPPYLQASDQHTAYISVTTGEK